MANTDKLSVGNAQVDADHRMLQEYIGLLHEAVNSGAQASEQSHLFAQLIEHTREHFRHEEALMQKMGYSGYEKHKAEHDMLLEEVQELLVRFNAGSVVLTEELFSYLEEWLDFHVATTDQKLAESVRSSLQK